jgi:hypothetical protein
MGRREQYFLFVRTNSIRNHTHRMNLFLTCVVAKCVVVTHQPSTVVCKATALCGILCAVYFVDHIAHPILQLQMRCGSIARYKLAEITF